MTTDTPSSRDEEIPTPRHDDVDSLPSGRWPHVAMREAKKLFADTPRTAAIIPVLRYHPGNSAWNQALLLARQLERELFRLSAEREKEREFYEREKVGWINAANEQAGAAKASALTILEYQATLAERDKELAEVKATWNEFLNCNPNSPFATIEKLTAQLLAAQTELASIPARVESDEIVCDRCGESCGRVNLPVPRTSTSPDPTLLDEVVKVVDELLGAMYRHARDVDDSPTIEHRSMCHRAEQLLSRLRQSTRETEENV